MDADVLRKQLSDEIQAQYESKLREIKRQKAQAEEELENASERWRGERRRLNSEIDRLETALAEAKGSVRGKPGVDAKSSGISQEDLAKVQQVAEERLARAMADWEAERERLVSQNSRLERAVAEAIERSSNPIRSTQAIKDQFEGRLQEAAKQRLEIEQELLRVKAAWDEDKKKLTAEIMKLRRLAPSKAYAVKEKIEKIHGHKESMEEARIRELEEQLTDARAETAKYHEGSVKAQRELADAIKELDRLQDIRSGNRDTSAAELATEIKREYEAKIRDLTQEKTREQARASQLETVLGETRIELTSAIKQNELLQRKSSESEQDSNGNDRARSAELDKKLATAQVEILKYRESAEKAERELATATKEIQLLQRTLSESHEQVSSDVVNQLRRQYDSKIQDIIQQKTQLARELEAATATLETERARFAGEFSKSQSEPAVDAKGLESEVKRVETLIEAIVSLIDDPATELSMVIRKNVEKAELNAYLRGILFSLGRAKAM